MLEKIKKMLYKTNVGARVMGDVNEFVEDKTKITSERILEELEYTLEKVEWDGWENHLENPQQIRSLKSLIKKVKNIIETQK